jgi:EmrB/QacA subfamily drug resistance transporter
MATSLEKATMTDTLTPGPTPGSPAAVAAEVDLSAYDPRRWWTLAVLCLSLLLVFVSNSSLNVAIPTLSRDLHATSSQLQWVVAVYSLVFAGLLFTTGSLGDRFGRKGALQLGLVLFLVTAAFASQATEMWELIGSRALMGAAAALIMPSTMSILVNIFPPQERPKAIAIWASVIGAAGAMGPLASGYLLGHFWYGSIFLVNVPIIAIALVAGAILVPRSRDPEQASLDPLGALLSIIGISSIVYGLIQAPQQGWGSSTTLTAFAIGAVVLAVFCWWELRVDSPMLDIRLFRNRGFSTGTGGMILVFLAMFGVMFLMSQYLQLVLGYSALSTAVRLLPMAVIMITVAPLTPRLTRRFGANRTVAGGMLLVSFGFVLFSFLSPHTPYLYVLLCLIPLVAGIALAMSPMTSSIMAAVPTRRAGEGSAMNDATRELGAALGVAVLGSIAASRYTNLLAPSLRGLSPSATATARSSLTGALQAAHGLPPAAAHELITAANRAFVGGIHVAALTGVLLAAAAAGIVWRFLPATAVQVEDFDEVDGPASLSATDDVVEEPFVHGTAILATE